MSGERARAGGAGTRGGAAALVAAALGGLLVGGIECAWLLRASEVVVATPVADAWSVAWRYAVAAALLALAALPLLALAGRASPRVAAAPHGALALLAAGSTLLFVVAGDWVHERLLANVPFFALRSLLATAALALGALLAGGVAAAGLARAPRATLAVLGLLGGAAFGAIAAGSVGGGAARPTGALPLAAGATPRHVVLLVIDTLRADRLGCYGYPRATSPELDALAAKGVLFEHASAQAPMTRGSVASLFTSLYPDAHATNDVLDRLPDAADTLAERLQRAGWRTACFSTNENVSPVFGFDQGFEQFWLHRLSRLARFTAWGRLSHFATETLGFGRVAADLDDSDARHLTDAVLSWLPPPTAAPQFLYVQYIDPHSPYAPPEDLLNDVSPDAERLATRGRFPHNCPPHPFGRWPEQEEGIAEGISQLYDAEIRWCDREVGRLVRELEARGYLRDSWLVITADHGEEFFDHAQLGHGHSMYDELLRVPLIVLGPGVVPGRVATPVQLVDLLPTLLAGVGIEPGDGLHGRDLRELLYAEGAERAAFAAGEGRERVAFAQRANGHPMAMVRVGSEKLIEFDHDDATHRYLYDLAADPREQHDLAQERPERVEALARLLAQRRAAARAARLDGSEQVELGDDSRNVLKALGYVDGDE